MVMFKQVDHDVPRDDQVEEDEVDDVVVDGVDGEDEWQSTHALNTSQ